MKPPLFSRSLATLLGASLVAACLSMAGTAALAQNPDADKAHEKIRFDLSRLNDSGLYGPPDGLRALDYEFCIPSGVTYATEIEAVDPSARVHYRSPGRIGCTDEQSLGIGSTRQPRFRDILRALAALPYVTRIDETFYE